MSCKFMKIININQYRCVKNNEKLGAPILVYIYFSVIRSQCAMIKGFWGAPLMLLPFGGREQV